MSWKPNNIQNDETVSNKKIETNRALNQRRDDDTNKNFSVTLLDIDQVVFDQLDSKINLQVSENGGEVVKVPILYGSSERWKSIRTDGFLRDHRGKIQIPLIVYKRNGFSKNESLTTLNQYLQHPVIKSYSVKNQYDKFSLLTGMCPVKEVYNVNMPDHVIVTYQCIVWTSFVEQNNSIIEQINWQEDRYWGDAKRYKFRAKIDNYSHTVELPADGDRMVRSEFTINVFAYLLPETAENKQTTQKSLTKRKIIFNTEVIENNTKPKLIKKDHCDPMQPSTTERPSINGSSNMASNIHPSGIAYSDIMTFLSTNKEFHGTFIDGNDSFNKSTVDFIGAEFLSTPEPLLFSITDLDKFIMNVNGQRIDKHAMSIQQIGNVLRVKVDNTIVGFSLDNSDEIIVIGKFK